jgi:ankyrin repeat protein
MSPSGRFLDACGFGDEETIKEFLDLSGPTVEMHIDEGFAICVAKGFIKLTKLLIDHGADINFFRRDALFDAVGNNQIEMTKFLVENEYAKLDDIEAVLSSPIIVPNEASMALKVYVRKLKKNWI